MITQIMMNQWGLISYDLPENVSFVFRKVTLPDIAKCIGDKLLIQSMLIEISAKTGIDAVILVAKQVI